MHALVLDRPGSPDTLRLAELPTPEPGPGQVRIRVEAAALNPVDYQVGGGGHPDWSWPHVLGLDVAGTVDALGEGVGHVTLGQRVAYHGDLRRPGGFAEYALAEADALAPVPEALDAATAAALPCAGMTAYQCVVRRLHVTGEDTVLITGGAGGVGGYAVQLAALAGARVIATASARNAEHVRKLGADEVIDYRGEDVPARVRELTGGRGVDAVIDTVSSESATANLALLAHGGGLASVAGRPDQQAVPAFTIAPSLHEIALGGAYSHGDTRARVDLSRMLSELFALTADGRLDPMLARTLTLEEVPAGLTELASRHVRGKLVLSFA
ncbi:zinc-binding dehydrogenase [Streptomyces sp. DSM 44917]|uniref:Zinc-binding dehydrogenase n=1 Tax=Streptomyces boetiae TaxID=3075541 RepID=A0ABU2LFV6_9ACTN|nr:zinc-binding dehydrogenase [Streptomyces sp. DSM 44917]MDT0310422.1 zinc-binding dehydrogenase [Streptomyces sp. DSM 44917]